MEISPDNSYSESMSSDLFTPINNIGDDESDSEFNSMLSESFSITNESDSSSTVSFIVEIELDNLEINSQSDFHIFVRNV